MQDDIQPQAPVATDPMSIPAVTPVMETPVVEVAPVVEATPAPAQVGPDPVVMPVEEVKTDVKVEFPQVPAMETPVATPVVTETPTV